LGAAAALFVYLVATLPQVRRVVFWHEDVRVLQFSSYGDLVLANSGDGPIFASHVDIEGDLIDRGTGVKPKRFTMVWTANFEVASGGIGTKVYANSALLSPGSYNVAANMTDAVWERALTANTLERVDKSDQLCFVRLAEARNNASGSKMVATPRLAGASDV